MAMNSQCINKCRFCYNYKPQSLVETCCAPTVCTTNEFISSISSLTPVIYNSSRTTERSLLLQGQQQFLQDVYTSSVVSTLTYTQQNISTITNDVYGQLLQLRGIRYEPYKPYIYPVVPSSVTQLLMNTANAGVPESFFTIMDCKGSQSVTT